jgi:hypothetical protein
VGVSSYNRTYVTFSRGLLHPTPPPPIPPHTHTHTYTRVRAPSSEMGNYNRTYVTSSLGPPPPLPFSPNPTPTPALPVLTPPPPSWVQGSSSGWSGTLWLGDELWAERYRVRSLYRQQKALNFQSFQSDYEFLQVR